MAMSGNIILVTLVEDYLKIKFWFAVWKRNALAIFA